MQIFPVHRSMENPTWSEETKICILDKNAPFQSFTESWSKGNRPMFEGSLRGFGIGTNTQSLTAAGMCPCRRTAAWKQFCQRLRNDRGSKHKNEDKLVQSDLFRPKQCSTSSTEISTSYMHVMSATYCDLRGGQKLPLPAVEVQASERNSYEVITLQQGLYYSKPCYNNNMLRW